MSDRFLKKKINFIYCPFIKYNKPNNLYYVGILLGYPSPTYLLSTLVFYKIKRGQYSIRQDDTFFFCLLFEYNLFRNNDYFNILE